MKKQNGKLGCLGMLAIVLLFPYIFQIAIYAVIIYFVYRLIKYFLDSRNKDTNVIDGDLKPDFFERSKQKIVAFCKTNKKLLIGVAVAYAVMFMIGIISIIGFSFSNSSDDTASSSFDYSTTTTAQSSSESSSEESSSSEIASSTSTNSSSASTSSSSTASKTETSVSTDVIETTPEELFEKWNYGDLPVGQRYSFVGVPINADLSGLTGMNGLGFYDINVRAENDPEGDFFLVASNIDDVKRAYAYGTVRFQVLVKEVDGLDELYVTSVSQY